MNPIPHPADSMTGGRKIKLIVGFIIIGICLGYLVTTGLKKSVVPYRTVEEFIQEGYPDSTFRLTGWVMTDSVIKSEDGLAVDFQIESPVGSQRGVPVNFKGTIPDTFKAGSEVVVEGRYLDGNFGATSLMAKCPSKYEAAKEDGESHPEEIVLEP